MFAHLWTLCLFVLVLLTSVNNPVQAVPVIPSPCPTPSNCATTEALGATGIPILSTAFTYQEQIADSHIALAPGSVITGLRWRLNNTATAGFSSSWTNYTIQLAGANQTVAGLTPGSAFAANMSGAVTVYSGIPLAVSLPGSAANSGTTPEDFGTLVSFTTPYTYLGGDLILYYTHDTGTIAPTVGVDAGATTDADYNGGGGYKALSASGFNTLTSSAGVAAAVVVDLQVVPEPGTLVLTGFGLLSLLGYRLWRRRVVH